MKLMLSCKSDSQWVQLVSSIASSFYLDELARYLKGRTFHSTSNPEKNKHANSFTSSFCHECHIQRSRLRRGPNGSNQYCRLFPIRIGKFIYIHADSRPVFCRLLFSVFFFFRRTFVFSSAVVALWVRLQMEIG